MNRHKRRKAAKMSGAGMDPGFDRFRDELRSAFPAMDDRTVGEAWMRKEVFNVPFGSPEEWKHMPGAVTIQLTYKNSTISAGVPNHEVQGCIDKWDEVIRRISPKDPRGDTRDALVNTLATNKHNDEHSAYVLCCGALWLARTSEAGTFVQEHLNKGDCGLKWEITFVSKGQFNFRLHLTPRDSGTPDEL